MKVNAVFIWFLSMVVVAVGAFQLGRRSQIASSSGADTATVSRTQEHPRKSVAEAEPTRLETRPVGPDTRSSSAERIEALLRAPASPERDKHLAELFRSLGITDGGGAFAHIEGLSGRARDIATSSILLGWATVDPEGAWNWAVKAALASGHEWSDTVSVSTIGHLMMLVNSMYRDGNAAKIPSLLEALPEGAGKDTAVGMYAKLLVLYDKKQAMAFLDSLEGTTRAGVLRSAAVDLARDAPEQTADWALKLPLEDGGPAIKSVISQWLALDASRAVDWIRRQPRSTIKDRALDQFVSESSFELLQANQDLVSAYSSPESQKGGLERLSRRLAAFEKLRSGAP